MEVAETQRWVLMPGGRGAKRRNERDAKRK